MFPNTPEVSHTVFSIYRFGCLRETLVVTKVFGGFFVSSESVSFPYGTGRKFEAMK